MGSKYYDVVIYDAVGMAYRGNEDRGLGGSEFAVIRLSKALASKGLRVLVKNNMPEDQSWTFDKVDFSSRFIRDDIETKTLILQRYSKLPANIGFGRLLIQVHDMPEDESVEYMNGFFLRWPTTTLVSNSEWQRQLYPMSWKAVVIPCLLPEATPQVQHVPGHYVYASAAMKGLKETLAIWGDLVAKHSLYSARLHVISSWDDPGTSPDPSVKVYGQLSYEELAALIAGAEGMFYCNRFPETFCVTAAMAERLGTRVHILCTNGFGALPEVLSGSPYVTDNEALFRETFLEQFGKPPVQVQALKDYSVEAGVRRWFEVLKEPKL